MPTPFLYLLTSFSLSALLPLSSIPVPSPTAAQERESIHDRIVHLESEVRTEIPNVPRLEESLGIEGRLVSVGDAEFWVEEEGEGTPLILINGGPGGTHHTFHPWFGRAAGFAHVIYYDQRGCGLSEYQPGSDGYSVDQAVEDLEGLRNALGLEKVVLAGFSYGGFLAQYYTVHYPENVAGLVLVGASPGMNADLGRSRQRDFMAAQEVEQRQRILAELRELAPSRGWSDAEVLALLVYNNFLNGDWKRQHYYKPSPEKMAQIAKYEWVQDANFNGVMGQSMNGIDFTGLFDDNPIPTLIMEGEWDLTWGPEKRSVLAGNHPNGTLSTFSEAGHSIFDEDPDGFFDALEGFVQSLNTPDPAKMVDFQAALSDWHAALEASPARNMDMTDWGWGASREIAKNFDPAWIPEVRSQTEFLRLGFALYDVKRYEDAHEVFRAFAAWGEEKGEETHWALASIWTGHMLDLLGRRDEALGWYRRVAELGLDDTWSHGQYGLRYSLSPWARERIQAPFVRVENSGG